MPFLIPPSEFKPGKLTQLGLIGARVLQICRSTGPWFLGTSDRVEHSIQNACLKGMYAALPMSSNPNTQIARFNFPNILSKLRTSSSSRRMHRLSFVHPCGLVLMDKVERLLTMWLLRTRLVTRLFITSFVHIVKASRASTSMPNCSRIRRTRSVSKPTNF